MIIRKQIKRLFWIFAPVFILHYLVISLYGLMADYEEADLIVIMGSKVETTGVPSQRLQARLNEGLKLYMEGKADKIMVTGGIGIEGYDEAAVMADYLIQKGVDSTDIYRDSLGINSFASAQNTKAILEAENLKSIIVVSQYFHLLRSKIAFQRMGISSVDVSGPAYFEWRDFYSIFREMVGLYYYLLRDYG